MASLPRLQLFVGKAPGAAKDAAAVLTLDTRDLNVSAVESLPSGQPLSYAWGDRHEVGWCRRHHAHVPCHYTHALSTLLTLCSYALPRYTL